MKFKYMLDFELHYNSSIHSLTYDPAQSKYIINMSFVRVNKRWKN